MFCGACGYSNPPVNRFCVDCGARIGTDPGGAVTDDVSARLSGMPTLPSTEVVWPGDLPREVDAKDGTRLRLVPAGFFWMGNKKQKKDERPYHLVYLDSYYVDETPVTCGQYQAFVQATGRSAPPGLKALLKTPEGERLPVTSVTWDDAAAYARWALRRLPTEAEWEKAARGVDGRLYPWGKDEPTGRANVGPEPGRATPVGSYPEGRSPFGALDMAGNVWEWCQDTYDQDFYPRANPRNPLCEDGDPRYRVLRGGSFGYSPFTLRASYRGWNLPHQRVACYGFRCAVEASRYRKAR
ncbi:MAG: SUMF1/EgtB/PvdO family nonheme iron enzyme [Myxococcales bacterium]|nr:SUMF1/EgtB/PvdO family nonheme iron enzyme [Myxococcales bacterium]